MDINEFGTWDGAAKHVVNLTMLLGIGNMVTGLNNSGQFEAGLILFITGYFGNRIRKEVLKSKFPANPNQTRKVNHSQDHDRKPPNSGNPEL